MHDWQVFVLDRRLLLLNRITIFDPIVIIFIRYKNDGLEEYGYLLFCGRVTIRLLSNLMLLLHFGIKLCLAWASFLPQSNTRIE